MINNMSACVAESYLCSIFVDDITGDAEYTDRCIFDLVQISFSTSSCLDTDVQIRTKVFQRVSYAAHDVNCSCLQIMCVT